jgi:hypothetical protein
MAVPSSAKVSALEENAIFTDKEEVPLADVFKKIYENNPARRPTIINPLRRTKIIAGIDSPEL